MRDANWDSSNLRQLLVSQQDEYHRLGLEHSLYAETDEAFKNTWIFHRMLILSLVPAECRRPGIRVVDIGGGKGRMTTLLSDLGLECVNIDNLFLDERAKNVEGKPLVPLVRAYCEGKGVTVLAHDVFLKGIPYPDQSFDLAICSEVIEHLPNSPKPVLAEIYRTLVKGGSLILTTPNTVSLGKRKRIVFGQSAYPDFASFYNLQRGYPAGTAFGGHIREYTRREVEQMLVWESFAVTRCHTCDFSAPTGFGDLIRCWLHGHTGIVPMLKKMIPKIIPELSQQIVALARK